MQRDRWEFEHTAGKLATAADEKKRHHVARREWWERQKVVVMNQIREKGISVHESVAAESRQYSIPAHGAGARIMVDATLQRDLDECTDKVRHHREQSVLYEGWGQILRGNPEACLKLHADDYLFFFGTPGAVQVKHTEDDDFDDR